MKVVGAQTQLDVAKAETETKITELMSLSNSYKKETIVAADALAKIIMPDADARLEAAQHISQAAISKARAEGQAQQYFIPLRQHEVDLKKIQVQERMAEKAKLVISGKNGEEVLKFFKNSMI